MGNYGEFKHDRVSLYLICFTVQYSPGVLTCIMCDIPWYRAFPRNPFIINISMYFGATEKWHVQMVMVTRVVQLAGASDAPPGTRVSNRGVVAGILMIADV